MDTYLITDVITFLNRQSVSQSGIVQTHQCIRIDSEERSKSIPHEIVHRNRKYLVEVARPD